MKGFPVNAGGLRRWFRGVFQNRCDFDFMRCPHYSAKEIIPMHRTSGRILRPPDAKMIER
ncbi:MAG: hypothetical protein KA004_08580 [Verrucomicrobiales bacterium]|nr:hypothetical protein [Verrucomicrobiales bacterium]